MSALLCELSPTVVLHRRSLTERKAFDAGADNACIEGLEAFDEFAALQGHESELHLTIVHLLWAATDERTRGFLHWAQEAGVLPRLNLRGANLRYADLRDADLGDADLRGAWRLLADATIDGWVVRDGRLERAL